MRGYISALQRKIASIRHGSPAKGMSVVLVAGDNDTATTAALLKGILTEAGKKAALVPARYRHSINSFYAGLTKARKQGYMVAIVEVDESLANSGVLKETTVDSVIVTSTTTLLEALLELNPKHLVVPTEYEVPDGAVEPYQHITVGEELTADARVESVTLYRKGTEVKMTIDHQTKLEIATPLVGRANALYLATAVAAAYVSGTDLSVVQEGVADIEPLEGQFERVAAPKEVDCYIERGGDEIALQQALDSAKHLAKKRLVVAIDDTRLTRQMCERAKEAADRLVVANYSGEVPSGVEVVNDGQLAVEKALRSAQKNDFVLLYGDEFTARDGDELRAKKYLGEHA